MSNQYQAWSIEEDNIMKEYYHKISIQELMNLLPRRTKKSIRIRANKLSITNPDWNETEVEFLKDNYLKLNYSKIADKLGRSKSAVQQKARLLGLVKARPSSWSNDEIQFLKDNFNSLTYDDIQKKIKRSLPSIYNKVYELGLSSKENKYKKLKYNQRLFILNNCHKMSDRELAEMFGVGPDSIADLRKKNGIKKLSNSSSNKMTHPEKIVNDILIELGVDFQYNSFLNGYYPDFLINGEIIIEVQGDYFHCNPRLYPNGPNEAQIEYIVKDYYKKCFYEGNNIPTLYLWEFDILNNLDTVKAMIIEHCRLVEKSSRV